MFYHTYIADNEELYRRNIFTFMHKYVNDRQAINTNQQEPIKITIGVSGGSMAKLICLPLKTITYTFPKVEFIIFPVDERLVPTAHSDNNMHNYIKEFSDGFNGRIIVMSSEFIDDAKSTAESFTEILRNLKPPIHECFPVFDFLFLGIGPDGHTCSLFPGHNLLKEDKLWVAAIEDSPKPPPRRITITLPVINAAKIVAFIITGESKAQIVKEIIRDRNMKYPPSMIQRSEVHFFLDPPAASQLKPEDFDFVLGNIRRKIHQ